MARMQLDFRLLVHTFRVRPRLFWCTALATALGVLMPASLFSHAATRLLVAWSLGTCAYLALVAQMMLQSTPDTMRRRARIQSESRLVTMALVILAVAAAMAAVFVQLTVVKDMHGSQKVAHIALAALTIVSAWTFTHVMFALHYAHDFYDAAFHRKPPGLAFPGTEDPEYGDFLYCAFIIGTSAQTADVSFTGKAMRRMALVHSVLAFLFNTTVLALTINMAASFL
jgi:uncharacterized membrane protein